MVFPIKKKILAQLRNFGLNYYPLILKTLPPNLIDRNNNIGRTFYIDLPKDTTPNILKINDLNKKSEFIENVQIKLNEDIKQTNQILLQVNYEILVKSLFNDLKQDLNKLISNHQNSELTQSKTNLSQKIIVEFSSPNIAKPFHVGNFRSTIIGNSVANILTFHGHNVVRMNYLGDWGTQFGILILAFEKFGDENLLRKEPLKHLFDVYVKGNQEIELNSNWKSLAKERFHQLETHKQSSSYKNWSRFRSLSLIELQSLYDRLGISFDVFSSESMYSEQHCHELIEILKKKSLIQDINGTLYANINHCNDPIKRIQVPLLKNDGSTLYLTRDIAAALDRHEFYNFDLMYYVVDSSQAKHFNILNSVFRSLDNPIYKYDTKFEIKNLYFFKRKLNHLKFGRIIGMSTRKGKVIFLEDVLNEAKNLALKSIKSSPSKNFSVKNYIKVFFKDTKISSCNFDDVADVLGISSLIVHDLSNRRVTEYSFDWNKALRPIGNTGISLQYTHARLCNLIKNCGFEIDFNHEIEISAINSDEGRLLVNMLLLFDDVMYRCCEELDPYIITNYLFKLKNAINQANQKLKIKGQEKNLAKTRLLLFYYSKKIFNQCMKLIGLKPLESI